MYLLQLQRDNVARILGPLMLYYTSIPSSSIDRNKWCIGRKMSDQGAFIIIQKCCTAHSSSDVTSHRCLFVREKQLLLAVTKFCPDGQNCYQRADQGVQQAYFSPIYTGIRSHKLQITIIYLSVCDCNSVVLSHSSSHTKRPSET